MGGWSEFVKRPACKTMQGQKNGEAGEETRSKRINQKLGYLQLP